MNPLAPALLDPMLKTTVQAIATQVLAQNPAADESAKGLEPKVTRLAPRQTRAQKAA